MASTPFFKKVPWLSLSLLIATYFNFGWVLSASAADWWVWLLIIVYTLGIAEALAAPFSMIRYVVRRLISSDTKAFLSAIVASFFGIVILSYFDISGHALLLIAVAALLRLDLQAAAIGELKSFMILSAFSLLGLTLGSAAYWGVNHYSWVVKFLN
ncbi:hypothetical protein [Microcoleus sp. FACHB-672]|uniref:hypothetical protein n=1 Tax=Microcoleus sp. FACHB-672 TaxID=2692825 RepID=UPI001A7E45BD|nr:hypothetical protein [Microcoleus sp. FACHB-672]